MAPEPVRRDPLPMFGTEAAGLAASVLEDPTLPVHQARAAEAEAAEPGPFPPPPEGAGPLVSAAWPLLALLARLRAGATARPEGLRTGCIAAIRRFETEAHRGGVAGDLIHAARYALCSAIDEQVLGTPWGDTSDWSAGSLLATFHNETWGGEKVFAIVEVALAGNGKQRDLTLLLFHLLSLGFQGRYRLRRDGTAEVEALRDRLFQSLRAGLAEAPPPPAAPPPAPARGRWSRGRRRTLRSWPPVWVVAAGSALAAALLFVTYEALLLSRAERLATSLLAVDRPLQRPSGPAPALPPIPQPLPPGPAATPAPAMPSGTVPPGAMPPVLTPGGLGEYPRAAAPAPEAPASLVLTPGGLGEYQRAGQGPAPPLGSFDPGGVGVFESAPDAPATPPPRRRPRRRAAAEEQ